MLEEIEINHFRGVSRLRIADFAAINIFVGANGAGKTSIMEAIGIISNPLNPRFIGTLGQWRELPPLSRQNDYSLRTLFYGLDFSRAIEFRFTVDGAVRRFSIERSDAINSGNIQETSAEENEIQSLNPATDASEVQGFKIEYVTDNTRTGVDVQLTGTGMEQRITYSPGTNDSSPPKPPVLGCFFIQARRATSAGETSTLLTRLFEAKSEEAFVQAMQKVDGRVRRIIPGFKHKQPVVLVDIGLSNLIPMNVLGDGFCRICLMLTGVLAGGPQTVVIDEIDSGLHHSVMNDFWRSLLELVRLRPVQVFCTTHSEEMLRKTLGAFSESTQDLRIFRIDKKQDGSMKVQPYTYQQFATAEKAGLDVR